jgi:hypothetical protein
MFSLFLFLSPIYSDRWLNGMKDVLLLLLFLPNNNLMDSLRHGAAQTHNNPKSFTGEKGGRWRKKGPHAEFRKKDFLLYSSSSSLMERMRGFLAGATSTPIAYYKFFRVGSGR